MRATGQYLGRFRAVEWYSSYLRGARLLAVSLIISVVTGCVSEPALENDKDLQSLLAAYQARTAEIDKEQQQRVLATIKQLSIAKTSDGSQFVISVDLADAPIALVIDRILGTTRVSYDLSDISLNGTVTARFNRVPLLVALNQLVNPHGLSVDRKNGILVFQRGLKVDAPAAGGAPTVGDAAKAAPKADNIYEEVALRHLKGSDAVALLKGLYAGGGSSAITIGELPELNAVYIGGQPNAVTKAVAVLNQADQEVPHVLIEALVVQFDVDAVAQLGTKITDGAAGKFSGINLIPGQLGANVGFTFLDGIVNPAQLTVTIDLLTSIDKAQVLSRPYLATRSNQPAQIQVVTERFVAVQKTGEGTDVTTTDPIDAGVTLNVTPIVLAELDNKAGHERRGIAVRLGGGRCACPKGEELGEVVCERD